MVRIVTLLFGLALTTSLFAHPKEMGNITGTGIQLKTIEHGFAGAINNRVVLGYKQKQTFLSKLTIIENDQETTTTFEKLQEGGFGGTLQLAGQGAQSAVEVRFLTLDKNANVYKFLFNNEVAEIQVNAEDFQDDHFINPEYTMVYRDKTISFQLEGQACYGYSLHLIAMIMGAAIL